MLYHTVIFCMCSFNIHCVGHRDSVNREERKENYNLELELNNCDQYEESKISQIKGEYPFLVL